MQTYKDTETGQYWQFDDDVIVQDGQFFAPHDPETPLDVPATLVPAELMQPPEPSVADFQAAKIVEINAAFTQAAAALTEGYPESERLTWPVQQKEVLAWADDPDAPTPYLDGLAAARGITPEEMRQKTLDQTQLFMSASQQLVGTRQRLRDMVYEAKTQADLDAIYWPTT